MTLLTQYYVPGLHIEDRSIRVPLDWTGHTPGEGFDGESISLFYRVVTAPEHVHDDLPLLVFLQGGPGGPGPRLLNPHQRWVDRGGDQALPGGVARPAWHRALQSHRNAYDGAAGPGRPRGAGRVSQAVPGRFDHPRFRTPAPHRIRRRAVGHAGPELRRIPDLDLSIAVPGGRDRQLHHRRHPACARRRHGGLRAHLPAHGREDAPVL